MYKIHHWLALRLGVRYSAFGRDISQTPLYLKYGFFDFLKKQQKQNKEQTFTQNIYRLQNLKMIKTLHMIFENWWQKKVSTYVKRVTTVDNDDKEWDHKMTATWGALSFCLLHESHIFQTELVECNEAVVEEKCPSKSLIMYTRCQK